MNNVNPFYQLAKKFCSMIESTTTFKQENCKELLLLLSNLYSEALTMPEIKELNDIDKFTFDDIKIEEYESYPTIKAPLCVGL